MISLYDFSNCKENFRTYGGNAGRKASISFKNSSWIIKYPGNLKKIPDIALDYSSSPISEYLGSHIYELLGIPVHETRLGFFDDKLVVACKERYGHTTCGRYKQIIKQLMEMALIFLIFLKL